MTKSEAFAYGTAAGAALGFLMAVLGITIGERVAAARQRRRMHDRLR